MSFAHVGFSLSIQDVAMGEALEILEPSVVHK